MVQGVRLVVLGKQGAGKGTQCSRLARHYVVAHIATGDMFRAAERSGSPMGLRVRRYMEEGELIPDDVVIGVVRERLAGKDAEHRGFVLDGFPRTVAQAAALAETLAPRHIDLVIDLVVPTEVALERLARRRVCSECGANHGLSSSRGDRRCDECGGEVVARSDDTEGAIRRRLELYEEQTKPLVSWYQRRGELVGIDGLGPPDEVTARLVGAVDTYQRHRVP